MFKRSARRIRRPSLIRTVASCLLLSGAICGCGGGSNSGGSGDPGGGTQYPQPPAGFAFLEQSDVMTIVQTAAATADSSTMAIAVTDRLGNILAVWEGASMPAMSTGNFGQAVPTGELAVNLARTASFFSNDQAPLSSRTVRYISGIHFPPGIANTPNAALYGIENTNRGCSLSSNYIAGQAIPAAITISGAPDRLGVITGKVDVDDSDPNAVNPGGVPIFKSGHMVGGVGIAGVPLDVAEFVAYTAAGLIGVPSAQTDGVGFQPLPPPGEVVIDGIALPFVNNTTAPSDLTPATGPFDSTRYVSGPITDPIAGPTPEGYLVGPTNGTALTAGQVDGIIMNAVNTADQTRALIRLPLGSRARMMIAVSDLDGTIIGLYRMHDATVFSIDVAASKARNVVYFSGPNRTAGDLPGVPIGTAVTNRTIGFGAQPLFPPGINGSSPGPFFGLYTQDVANPCTQGADPPGPPGPNVNQSGIVFFPGSEPLYVNGVMVGGLGVSGDGVDQDDYVTSGGGTGYEAPANIQADQISIDGVRLPFLHFPRNPTD
jgi:uncharacterized protein GlcG (DUF336 family)